MEARIPYLSPEEYLEMERAAETKSEYFNGQIFAMSGASREHNVIAVNVSRELSTQLRGRPCETYGSDMRVQVTANGLYTYPDVTVACGEPAFEDAAVDTLLNPTVIIEVLSDSTEDYDRGRKFVLYQQLESLRDYVLIAQHSCRVDHYSKSEGDGWTLRAFVDQDAVVELPSIGCELRLAEVYARISFETPLPQQEGEMRP